MQARLNQIVDESSDTGKALTAWYAEHGIITKDTEGQIRSLYEVLTDVAKIWPKLTKNEQMYYLQQQAGTTQTQNLSALLQNFETAIKATDTALDSAGSAMRENAAYMESVDAKTQNLKAEFEDFANRVLSKEVVTGFLDAGDALLEFANTDIGASVTRVGALSATITSLVGIAGTAIGKIGEIRAAMANIGGAASLLTSPKTLLIVAGVATAIFGIVEAIKAVDDAYDEAHPTFEDAKKNLEETQDEIKKTEEELDNYKEKLKELNSVDVNSRGADWVSERTEIETNKNVAEAYLEILKQIEAHRIAQVEDSKYTTGYAGRYLGDYENGDIGTVSSGNYTLTNTQWDAIRKSYEDADQAIMGIANSLVDIIDWGSLAGQTYEEQIENLRNQLGKLGIEIYRTVETVEQSFGNIGQLADKAANGVSNLTQSEIETANKYLADYQAYISGLVASDKTLDDAQKNQIQNYVNLQAAMSGFDIAASDSQEKVVYLANYFDISADAAYTLAVNLGYIQSATPNTISGIVQLADGTYVLASNCIQATDGTWQLKDGIDALGTSSYDAANGQDAISQKVAEVAAKMVEESTKVDETSVSFQNLVAQEIMFGNNGLDITAKIAALRTYAAEIGATAAQLAALDAIGLGVADVNAYAQGIGEESVGSSGWRKSRKDTNLPTVSDALEEFNKISQEVAKQNKNKSGGGGGSVKKSVDETAEYAEKKAEEAAQKAQQEAEQAAQEAAQKIKEQINDTFDALKEAEEKYWDDKIDALETQNKLLDRQTQLEEKLKALQEAKERKILLYKNGQYQYSEDVGAIADAQAAYDETWRKIYNEEQKEILNDLKDKALAIIEEYRDKALENGQLTQADISALLSEYHELGNTTYETIAYGVENITQLVASGMAAITGNTGTMASSVSKAMGATSSAIGSMGRNITTASGLLNQTFGNGISSLLGGGLSIGGGVTRPMRDYVNEHWGETTGKFRDLSVLYGGGTAWWIGQMNKYLEDPEKNANLVIGTKADGSALTLKELYETDWTKRAGSASSMAEIEDYIQREQAKFLLAGGNKNDYDALQQIAQNAYRELYFRNPSAITGNNPMYAVDAALRYSGSDFNVWQGSYAGSGLFNNRNLQGYYTKSQWQIYQDMAKQAGWSGAGGEAGRWAQNRINEINQQIRSDTLNEIDRQIAENSRKWFDADEEERKRLHQLNEELRKNRGEIGGNANGTLSWRGGLSVVGEKGPELRVLNKGDGIIPADITENLWKMGSNPTKYFNDVVKSTSNAFNISNIELPSVTNVKEFVSALKNYALQYSYKR